MVAVNPKFKKPGLWQALTGGAYQGEKNRISGDDLPKKAIKCDLCKDNAMGPACVRSCPTGAAIRISPEALSLTMRDNSSSLE
jgi:Fe-S-cluster-containing hydrogenase component 2